MPTRIKGTINTTPSRVRHVGLHSTRRCVKGLPPSLPGHGTYVLVITLGRPIRIRVGALGRLHFKRGVYVYVGSARRGLPSRIRRHISKRKRLRWHIDWITSHRVFEIRGVWVSEAVGVECRLAEVISKQADGFIPCFGSSDCRCRSHLIFFGSSKMLDVIRRLGLSRVAWPSD